MRGLGRTRPGRTPVVTSRIIAGRIDRLVRQNSDSKGDGRSESKSEGGRSGWLTVSQVRHRVSLVSIPSKRLCTRVACEVGWPLLLLLLPLPLPPIPLWLFVVVLGEAEGVAEDARDPTLLDTVNREGTEHVSVIVSTGGGKGRLQ